MTNFRVEKRIDRVSGAVTYYAVEKGERVLLCCVHAGREAACVDAALQQLCFFLGRKHEYSFFFGGEE